MHETSTSETQTVLMETIDPDILLHSIALLHNFFPAGPAYFFLPLEFPGDSSLRCPAIFVRAGVN
jgi:hypothetical protein